jgi:ESCRT-I complex subunit VPS28
MSVPLSLDEEARLYTTNSELEKYESLATLYGIVVALDYLERAYVRDSVTAAECVVGSQVMAKALRVEH